MTYISNCAETIPLQIVESARQYLACTNSNEREILASRLGKINGDPEQILRSLLPEPETNIKAGYYQAEHFRSSDLLQKHPDDILYYIIPDSYTPTTPTGLIIWMHGGGSGSKRNAPDDYLTTNKTTVTLGAEFRRSGMITVAPSAPWHAASDARWCIKGAEDYIRDVILEFKNRFNIDHDRIFLMGYSMGGMGAYHQVQQQPDRFAAVMAGAGSWYLAYWPVCHGTPLWIIHGARDAVPGKRPHFTDTEFARMTDQLMSEQKVDHIYREHSGGHDVADARDDIRYFLSQLPMMKRDPYYPHIVAASPVGWSMGAVYPSCHNRWVTIIETKKGVMTYDLLESEGSRQAWKQPVENWDNWRLVHKRRDLQGAWVEAVNLGSNRFDVATRNVTRFSLWFHPKMADFNRPISVKVNQKQAIETNLQPSIVTALRSFERRRDAGLIYTAELIVDVPTE